MPHWGHRLGSVDKPTINDDSSIFSEFTQGLIKRSISAYDSSSESLNCDSLPHLKRGQQFNICTPQNGADF